MKKLLLTVLFAGGLGLALAVQNLCAEEEIISVGDVWRYFKGVTAPPADWHSLSFDATTWVEGPTGIGYSTDITYATDVADMAGAYWSVFARTTFSIADPNDVSALRLGIKYDDGFIAYINGTEIARSLNMVDPVNYNTPTTFDHDEEDAEEFFTLMNTPSLLQTGNNVLAIQFHNVSATSSDAGIIPRLILIDNMLPEASVEASYPQTGEVPLSVQFDASSSQDTDGTIAVYSWNFGDGTPVEQGSNPMRQHAYTAQGMYQCVLEVTDNKGGKDTASVAVVVGPSRTIYVDKYMTGSFNGSGDAVGIYDSAARQAGSGSETAYNTFMEASLQATAGDTIVIRGGIYKEALRPMHSGNASAPITYTNFGDEVVIIRDTPGISNLTPDEVALDQPGRQYGIYMYDVSYVIIKGLQVTNVTGWCRVVQSDHITLRNNTFTAALGEGTTGSIKFYHSDFNKVLNNTIHDGNDNLMLIHSDRNLVEGNHIIKGRHCLWCIRAGNFNMIRGNYLHNEIQKIGEVYDVEAAKDTPIMYDAAKHNIIEKNIFAYTPPPPTDDITAGPYNGIQFAGQKCIIRKNVFHNNEGGGVDLTLYADESRYNYENRIYNNVFYKNMYGGIAVSRSTSYTFYGNILKNNILYKNGFIDYELRIPELHNKPVQVVTYRRSNDYVFDGNNFFSAAPGESFIIGTDNLADWQSQYPAIFTAANMEQEPMFVSVDTGYDAAVPDSADHDFTLAENSPMIDAGLFLTAASGSGSGSSMPVEDAGYFYDGYDIQGEKGDIIQLSGQSEMARIVDIDYTNSILILDKTFSWSDGQGVTLRYIGSAPDLGAFEYGLDEKELYIDPEPEPEANPDPEPETKPEALIPDVNALTVLNNIIKKGGNQSALIRCDMKKQNTLTVKIYDAKGKEIITICNEQREAGRHEFIWSGKDSSGNAVGSGIYMVHCKVGGYTETKKIAIIK